MVPPLFDPTSGSSISGVVDVQVIQVSDTTLATSNLIEGLQIAALPPVPAGTPIGSRTAALLNLTLDVFSSTQSSLSGNPTLSRIATIAPDYSSNLSELISAINTITANPSTSVSFSTANGSTVTLDAKTLALSDQMAQALVAELASKTRAPATAAILDATRNRFIPVSFVQVSDECPPYLSDPTAYDVNLCYVKRIYQNLSSDDPAVLAQMEKTLASLAVGMLTGGLSLPYQLIASGVWTLSYSFLTTGAPPPGGDVVEGMATTTIDDWAKKNGQIGFTYDLFNIFYLAATTVPSQTGMGIDRAISSGYAGNTYLLLPDGTKLVKVPDTQGSVPIDTTTLVVPFDSRTPTPTPQCPEPRIDIYHKCLSGCDGIDNLIERSKCSNTCISDFMKSECP